MGLSYDAVGGTAVADPEWSPPSGYRAFARTVPIGRGEATWTRACDVVMSWGVKKRSGFDVRAEDGGDQVARVGRDFTLVARLGLFAVPEPARVVAAVNEVDRCGFAYGTRTGHPVSGEEAFIVSRDSDQRVWLTLRSLTRASPGRWRLVFPLLLIAQRWYRRRYLRAFTGHT